MTKLETEGSADVMANPSVDMVVLEATLRPERAVALPEYPGSMVRGAVGTAFRRMACLTGARSCEKCPALPDCGYGRVWEEPPRPVGLPRRFGTPPKPYAFDVSELWSRGRGPHDSLTFRIKLFGDAVGSTFFLCEGLRHVQLESRGEPVQCTLASVEAIDPGGQRVHFKPGPRLGESLPVHRVELGSTAVAPSGRVRLKFHSPVALTKDEKTGGTVTPELLTARLLDRFELLVRAYQREPVEWDHGRFRELAAAVRVVKSDLSSTAVARQSRRASRMIPLRGVAGTLEVDSVEPRLFALWRLGEAIQVGKQTAFGFGVMRAEWC